MTIMNWLFGRAVVGALLAALAMSAAFAEEQKKKPDPQAVARGAKGWAENCGRCHNVRNPKELRDDQWKPVITHMRIRAGLTGQESREILLFIQNSN